MTPVEQGVAFPTSMHPTANPANPGRSVFDMRAASRPPDSHKVRVEALVYCSSRYCLNSLLDSKEKTWLFGRGIEAMACNRGRGLTNLALEAFGRPGGRWSSREPGQRPGPSPPRLREYDTKTSSKLPSKFYVLDGRSFPSTKIAFRNLPHARTISTKPPLSARVACLASKP